MSDAITRSFNASVQKTYEWLRDVEKSLSTEDRHAAYHALRSVLHALRDRLIPEEARDLAEQLPALLRGIYYQGWSPTNKPDKMNRAEFLDRIRTQAASGLHGLDPDRCVRAVFQVLAQRIAAGEISDIRRALPDDFAVFWPLRSLPDAICRANGGPSRAKGAIPSLWAPLQVETGGKSSA